MKNSYISRTAFFVNFLYNNLYLIFINSLSIVATTLLSLLLLLLLMANPLLGDELGVYYSLSDLALKVEL